MNDPSATSSVIGYYYQGCYALVLLLDCDTDDAAVSIETNDDIEFIEGGITQLKQLKHKPGTPSPVSLKCDDIWKTIRIWCKFIEEEEFYFHFVTTNQIKTGDILEHLVPSDTTEFNQEQLVELVETEMTSEAKRIESKRDVAKEQGKKTKDLPYKQRWGGCQAFLQLNLIERKSLIRRIKLMPEQFLAVDIECEVEKRLKRVHHTIRKQVTTRLIEWWDRESAKALLKQRERKIESSELNAKIAELITSLYSDNLIDDFRDVAAPEKLSAPVNMALQIKWVDGGEEWISRATKVRWKSRKQRDKWLKEGMSAIQKLALFDQELKEEWEYRFEDSKSDCDEGRKKAADAAGYEVLKWSWYDAFKDVPPIQSDWRSPYLIRGTYQEMANRFQVGWHPEFEILKESIENDSDADD